MTSSTREWEEHNPVRAIENRNCRRLRKRPLIFCSFLSCIGLEFIVFCFCSVVMLLLIFATMFNTDNRLTSFFREHIPEILVLSYSIFFIKFTLARARDPWYDRFPLSLVVGSLVELGIAIAGAVVLKKLLGADKRQ